MTIPRSRVLLWRAPQPAIIRNSIIMSTKAVDPSPSPKQTFHKSKVHSPLLVTTNLLAGVSGAAHYSTTSQSPTEGTHSILHNSDAMSMDTNQPLVVLEGKRKQVFEDVLELFCSRPTTEIFQRSWRPEAVFEDPISLCQGYKEYAPQWYGMPKVFPKSITLSHRVVSSTHNPNRIMYQQEQEYTVRGLGTKKVMKSLVVIELDDNDMITHLHDKWNGEDHPTKWGAHALRRLNAMTLPWFVSVPKLEKHD